MFPVRMLESTGSCILQPGEAVVGGVDLAINLAFGFDVCSFVLRHHAAVSSLSS